MNGLSRRHFLMGVLLGVWGGTGCTALPWISDTSDPDQCSTDTGLEHIAQPRVPLAIRLAYDDRSVNPQLASLFAHELAAGLSASQQFAVRIVPAGLVPVDGMPPIETGMVEEGTGLVLEARIIEIRPYQPMLLRAEFELHDPWSIEPGVRLQGTWDAPTFPPNAATGPVRRFRPGRLPKQMLEEEIPLISTSPRMFARYAGGTIAESLTSSWNARYVAPAVGKKARKK